MILEPWQREFVWEALEVDQATGLRIYQEVGLRLPRKNGKSLLAAAFGHYFLVADGEAEPGVYVAAAARGQAGIVLGQARRIGIRSLRLRRHLRIQTHLIACPRNGELLRATSRMLVHDGHEELGRQTGRVVAKPTPKGWSVASGTREPIVAAQAAMLAVQRARTAQQPPSRVVLGLYQRRA